ncbi:CAAX prenyl protease 1 homolog [Bombus vancouverensis nearcticus]|uniref:CAAX prenyl protease 1 homolog n=1 Tax=Bombus vancouverensis nearcticus TaxID=2705178 RepID=UPI00143B2E12|nr:CAAX prenyl protease 1 homolog [Bombus vancouverensis nearcticus]XP_033189156.1 CAAX prenyl protease 1 homolog [Bombus vancouverensis nearcticus]
MSNFVKFIEENILYEILAVSWLLLLWRYYLNLRQRDLMMRLTDLPKSVEGLMTKDVYKKAHSYLLDRLKFNDFESIFSELCTAVYLLNLCYYRFWLWSIDIVKYCGFDDQNEILLSGVCMFIINVIYDIIILPFKIYSTFVVEQKHGFNKETPLFFVKDQLLRFVVCEILAVPFLCAVTWIIKNGGGYCFLYLWIFLIVAALFLMIIYPELIAPLFDKYTPLPNGDLKRKIEELAASINYPLYKIFIVENSKRSSHSNAYLYGFHKHKRIVLYDTLVKEYYKPAEGETNTKGCTTDEVVAVLAHELGHWKYSHTLKGFILGQVQLLMNIYLYAKLLDYKPIFEAFGFMDSQPTFIGFIIITIYISNPLNILVQYITNILRRRFEFEADKFAKILGHGQTLKSSLIKLQEDNLGFPLYDKLYSSWHHSHPQVLERIEAIDKED